MHKSNNEQETVINQIKSILSRHAISKIIMSDNGTLLVMRLRNLSNNGERYNEN